MCDTNTLSPFWSLDVSSVGGPFQNRLRCLFTPPATARSITMWPRRSCVAIATACSPWRVFDQLFRLFKIPFKTIYQGQVQIKADISKVL